MRVFTIITGILLLACTFAVDANPNPKGTFTIYSPPIQLRSSEIHNSPTTPVPLPPSVVEMFRQPGLQMFITNYSFDVVAFDEDREYQVPLFDVYNHHYILYMGNNKSMNAIHKAMQGVNPIGGKPCWHQPNSTADTCRLDSMATAASCLQKFKNKERSLSSFAVDASEKTDAASFGGAAGGEMRHNDHIFPAPYGIPVPSPESLMPVLHFINTRNTTMHDGPSQNLVSPYIQCPCTDERHFDLKNNTIDGCVPSPAFSCNAWFMQSNNTGCRLDLYTSGYRCCDNGIFLNGKSAATIPTPMYTVYAKMTFHFVGLPKKTKYAYPELTQVTLDVTTPQNLTIRGSGGNIEYTVPQCSEGTPPEECAYEVSTVQEVVRGSPPNMTVDLVHAMGHMHTGAISLKLINDSTGQLICDARLRYGTSANAGDEKGYIVGIKPCVYDPPLRIQANTQMRIVATYNNTQQINGVMALWFLQLSLPPNAVQEGPMTSPMLN